MYNRLYTYSTENKVIFEKQFGFKGNDSTDYALLEVIDQIFRCFDEKKYF